MASPEVQLAVLAAQVGDLITTLQDTNRRLARLESWRSFVLGAWAAAAVAGGVIGWVANTLVGK